MENKNCLTCNMVFSSPVWRKSKTCSYKCSNNLPKLRMTGKKHSQESKEKMSRSKMGIIPANVIKGDLAGENHPLWKGEKVSYRNLHRWVERMVGKPNKCEFCEKIGYGHQIHWANKSGEYKRDLSDWLRLCVKCHKSYDKKEVTI